MKGLLPRLIRGGLALFIALSTSGGIGSTESPKAGVTSDATSIPYFSDTFEGNSLDTTRWKGYTYRYDLTYGLSVNDGFLNLGFPSATWGPFPLVHSVRNPFPPSGDFILSIDAQYTRAGIAGTGIKADIGIPRAGEIPSVWAPDQKSSFDIWQDSSANNELVLQVNGRRAWGSGKGSLNLDRHNFTFEYRNGRVAIYVDGTLMVQPLATPRPTTLWMGNHVGQGSDWSSFKVDSVSVTIPLTSAPQTEVASTQGVVETLVSGDSVWRTLSLNDTLSKGDGVRTAAGATLLRFMDGSLLRLAEETQVQLKDHRKGDNGLITGIDLTRGSLWGYVNNSASHSLQITTTAGILTTTGGQWELESSAGVTTTLKVYSGLSRLTDTANSKVVTAGAGYFSTLTPGSQPTTPITFTMSSVTGQIPLNNPSYTYSTPLVPLSTNYPITSTDGLITGFLIETVFPSENGAYNIPAAPLQVVVAPSKMVGWSSDPTSLLVTPSTGQALPNINFALKKDDSVIRGLTRDDLGSPLSGVLVSVYPTDKSANPFGSGSATVSGDQGNYILDTAAGTWDVMAFLSGRVVTPTQQVAIGSGQTISDTNFTLTFRRSYLPFLVREYPGGW